MILYRIIILLIYFIYIINNPYTPSGVPIQLGHPGPIGAPSGAKYNIKNNNYIL